MEVNLLFTNLEGKSIVSPLYSKIRANKTREPAEKIKAS